MKQISESLKSFTDLKKNFTFPPPPPKSTEFEPH